MSIIEEHNRREQYIEEVAAYIRVSTQEQKLHGISLEAQVEKLQEYAANHNMKIVEWYKDEGVSGRKLIKNRPELQRMIHDAQKKKFKRIIFIKLDRFFRSVAEYHECMKLIAPVIWTATEEKFDLSTPSGVAFVNMKLTMAQLEADQASERIKLVNEYKIKTGQPLYGSQSFPFCYQVKQPEPGERHKCIQKRDEELMRDLIAHVMQNHSVRAGVIYINRKYGRNFGYNMAMKALTNEMICGEYKGNLNYCEPYITREEYDALQKVISRNPRTSTTEYAYIFTGLIRCPNCGNRLTGTYVIHKKKSGKKYKYYGYRCSKAATNKSCRFRTIALERRLERELLSKLEQILKGKQAKVVEMQNKVEHVSKYDVAELTAELDRLNYSWQKGRIKSVEEYDKRYDALMAQIDEANNEQATIGEEPDYERIQGVLESGWKDIYTELDNEHKRSFWRSFIDEIQIEWNKEVKQIVDVIFF